MYPMSLKGCLMIDWIFFDLDGVLVDSRELHMNALKHALASEGVILDENLARNLDGLPTKTKLQLLIEKNIIDAETALRINKHKQILTTEMLHKNIRSNARIRALLLELKSNGLRLAVCSNAIRSTLELSLEKLGIDDLFEFTISNEDVIKPKPSPEIYLKSLEKAQAHRGRVIIVEDSLHGIKAAVASGCHVVKVQNSSDLCWEIFCDYIEFQKKAL